MTHLLLKLSLLEFPYEENSNNNAKQAATELILHCSAGTHERMLVGFKWTNQETK